MLERRALRMLWVVLCLPIIGGCATSRHPPALPPFFKLYAGAVRAENEVAILKRAKDWRVMTKVNRIGSKDMLYYSPDHSPLDDTGPFVEVLPGAYLITVTYSDFSIGYEYAGRMTKTTTTTTRTAPFVIEWSPKPGTAYVLDPQMQSVKPYNVAPNRQVTHRWNPRVIEAPPDQAAAMWAWRQRCVAQTQDIPDWNLFAASIHRHHAEEGERKLGELLKPRSYTLTDSGQQAIEYAAADCSIAWDQYLRYFPDDADAIRRSAACSASFDAAKAARAAAAKKDWHARRPSPSRPAANSPDSQPGAPANSR